MKRTAALGVAVALMVGTGCTPRQQLAIGAATVVTSALVLVSNDDTRPCNGRTEGQCEDWLRPALAGLVNGVATGVGIGGLALMGIGGLGLYEEHGQEEKLQLEQAKVAEREVQRRPTLSPQSRDLSLQIQLAARGNRCPEAERLRGQLYAGDAAAAVELTARDEFVAHCAGATARLAP